MVYGAGIFSAAKKLVSNPIAKALLSTGFGVLSDLAGGRKGKISMRRISNFSGPKIMQGTGLFKSAFAKAKSAAKGLIASPVAKQMATVVASALAKKAMDVAKKKMAGGGLARAGGGLFKAGTVRGGRRRRKSSTRKKRTKRKTTGRGRTIRRRRIQYV
jgi:hypothetical protein